MVADERQAEQEREAVHALINHVWQLEDRLRAAVAAADAATITALVDEIRCCASM